MEKEEREETIDVPTLLSVEMETGEAIDTPIEIHPVMVREETGMREDSLIETEVQIATATEEATDSLIGTLTAMAIDAQIETEIATATEEMIDTRIEKLASAIEGTIDTPTEETPEDTEEKKEVTTDTLPIPVHMAEEGTETVEETTTSVTHTQIEIEDSLPLTGRMKLPELISQVEMTMEKGTIEEKAEVEMREKSPVQSLMDMTHLWRTKTEKGRRPSGSRVS